MVHFLPISEASNLAIHALVAINLLGEGRRISVSQLTKLLDVSQYHLAKVMQKLVKAGCVESTRGATGGFTLKSEAKSTSLLKVVETIDGPLMSQHCLFEHPRCAAGNCDIAKLQQETVAMIVAKLESLTIDDVRVEFHNSEVITK